MNREHVATLPLSERQFSEQIRDLARLLGWDRHHHWISKNSSAGWPDEVLIRPPRIVVAELKAEQGKPTAAQVRWLDQLAACGLDVCLWRPSMIDEIAAYLRPVTRPDEPGPGAWLSRTRDTKPA